MKTYRVIATNDAQEDLRQYLSYLIQEKHNPQAARLVLQDYRNTVKRLSHAAGSIARPDSEKLQARHLKRINFGHHHYFLLFLVDQEDTVYVTNVFNDLENFEEKLR